MNAYDVSDILDVEYGVNQLCPFYDNEMQEHEQFSLINAHGAVVCN